MDNETLKIVFSKNLNYWLDRRGKSQADLYKKMGISSATASDWCNAKKTPRVDKIVEIASWLMVEISDLIQDKQKKSDKLSDIEFKITDNERFRKLIFEIIELDDEALNRLEDYIHLLNRK